MERGAVPHPRREVLALLTAGRPQTPLVERVCEVAADLLGISGAGMCLVGGRRHEVVVHGTDALIAELEDLQVDLREGPCLQSVRSGFPVLVPDLDDHPAGAWPAFAAAAYRRGVRALFSFPLHTGGLCFGALDLYRRSPGPLDDAQLADAVTLTGLAAWAVVAQRGDDRFGGGVSALDWFTAEAGAGAAEAPVRAAELGMTVEEALAWWAEDINGPPGPAVGPR